MLRFVLFLSFALGLCQTAAAGVVRVANGDCVGLAKAVAQSSSLIVLARAGRYSACSFHAQTGSIDIDAQGATFLFLVAQIEQGAAVRLRNATITALDPSATATLNCPAVVVGFSGSIFARPAICNFGSFSLEDVAITNLAPTGKIDGGSGGFYSGLLFSSGAMEMRNIVIADNSDVGIVQSAGDLGIYNSTISSNSSTVFDLSNIDPVSDSRTHPTIRIANSLLTASTGPVCRTQEISVASLGGNVATDSSCGLSTATGDTIAPSLSLPAAADHGGLVPTVQIGYGNPGYRFGVAQYCEATDARGVTRNAANCDSGAYESGGGLGLVTENGMNGLYYVPGISNGHYVSVQRIHDNKDVMVFWNTFDQNGNQAWLFGVGTLTSDRHVHALMYRNLGGVLQPGGSPTGAKPSEWGTVDIDVTSCSAAQFNYQSSLPEFGSGQFPLTRLAFESAINCGD